MERVERVNDGTKLRALRGAAAHMEVEVTRLVVGAPPRPALTVRTIRVAMRAVGIGDPFPMGHQTLEVGVRQLGGVVQQDRKRLTDPVIQGYWAPLTLIQSLSNQSGNVFAAGRAAIGRRRPSAVRRSRRPTSRRSG